jgi:hypothetical protein
MDVLSTPISYAQIVDWGGSRFATETEILEWLGGREEVPLGELLARPVDPLVLLWVVARGTFMAEQGMHEAALRLTRDLLARLAESGAYMDFRCAILLDAKRRWLEGEASLGELRAAQAKGERLCEDLGELDDRLGRLAGEAAWQAVSHEGHAALMAAFRLADGVDAGETSRRQRLQLVVQHLKKEA